MVTQRTATIDARDIIMVSEKDVLLEILNELSMTRASVYAIRKKIEDT